MNKLLIILLFSPSLSFANGRGDLWLYWDCKTPNGNIIKCEKSSLNSDSITIYLNNNQSLKEIRNWYFYNSRIIGSTRNDSFFVVNELKSNILIFSDEADWQKYCLRNNLKPKFWARIYKTDYQATLNGFGILIVFGAICIPVLFLLSFFVRILVAVIFRKDLKYFKIVGIIFLLILFALVFEILLEIFPQSL